MQRTNHWFVAFERGAELRIGAWNAGGRLRAGAKHLCGQTCLHKLVDDFLMRRACPAESAKAEANLSESTLLKPAALGPTAVKGKGVQQTVSNAYMDDFESSARLIPAAVAEAALITEIPNYKSADWRTGAWQREREREKGIRHSTPTANLRTRA